ncbi:hemin uptake protein HemP [Atlantibacter subterranea]|uniref:Hemin uptake protein HemP n=2 Tax=Atlantibacter subterraneus TaxID=255519 RepID=A0A427V292_9ENTR|nr:hemin uptake protein HemP [Atlantibacter subterranea]RSE02004.1 hemin uptake protein HemP [Atlantibacter subterranea]RSE26844.1 hemin uptake protein HemP [Atlantibacter subterranea]
MMQIEKAPGSGITPKNAADNATAPRQIDSKTLLGPDGRITIVHDGQHYLLRQTQAGKLILTK